MDKKPILIIVCSSWKDDEIGGAYQVAGELAVYCAARGWQVHFIAAHGTDSKRPEKRQGVMVWRYASPKGRALSNWVTHFLGTRKLLKKILATIDKNSPVVLNGHSPLQYHAALGGVKNGIFEKWMSVHSPFQAELLADRPESAGPFSLKALMARSIEKACYRQSTGIQCDSHFTQDLLQKDFPSETEGKLFVCPAPVDVERFALPEMDRQTARKKLGETYWPISEFCFFAARRHVQRTGVDLLIRAAALLREKIKTNGSNKTFRVILAGDGPLRPELEQRSKELGLEDIVYFTGKMSAQDLPLAYRAADISVMPTRSLECFGLPVLESFASGTPVIATPVGALPEILGALGAESLCESATAEALAEKMAEALFGEKTGSVKTRQAHADLYRKEHVLDRLEKTFRKSVME